jgi:hypothetical protein
MRREDHILWKIAKAHEVVTELQFARNRGQLDKHEYAAKVAPICMEVMNRTLALIEHDGFIEVAEYNAQFYYEEAFMDPHKYDKDSSKEYHKYMLSLHAADWIVREYKKFIARFRHAIFEPDPVKRASELVLGMDSLVNWMHGCFYISGQIMRASPITGDSKKDYDIATHTMYLLYAKGIDETFEYLEKVIPPEF